MVYKVIIAISVGVSVKNPADDGQGKSFIILYLNHLYSKIYYSKMKKWRFMIMIN